MSTFVEEYKVALASLDDETKADVENLCRGVLKMAGKKSAYASKDILAGEVLGEFYGCLPDFPEDFADQPPGPPPKV